jgi:hypothetical protein
MANITISGLTGKTAVSTDEIEVQATGGGASNKVTLTSVIALGLASPTFTGTPAAPTAAAGTNTTQIATTAHVFAERTNAATLTNKTLTAPALNGIITNTGTDVTTANAMGALAIDVTRSLNTKSVSTDSTFTFSGTPANSNQWFGMELSNTDTNAHTMTIPSSFSYARQAAITSFVMPASSKVLLSWRYDGTVYNINGDPVAPANKAFNASFPTGGNDTVHLGFSPVAGNIVSATTQSDSGTATYTIQVNGVNVTGTANSVSSSKTTQSISAIVAIGDRVSVVRSANSTCVNGTLSVYLSPSNA